MIWFFFQLIPTHAQDRPDCDFVRQDREEELAADWQHLDRGGTLGNIRVSQHAMKECRRQARVGGRWVELEAGEGQSGKMPPAKTQKSHFLLHWCATLRPKNEGKHDFWALEGGGVPGSPPTVRPPMPTNVPSCSLISLYSRVWTIASLYSATLKPGEDKNGIIIHIPYQTFTGTVFNRGLIGHLPY